MTHQHDMDCQDILQNLHAYIDSELGSGLCGDIEAHLHACPDCQIVVNTLKKTIQLYKVDGQQTTLPGEVKKRLLVSLDLENYDNQD